MALKKSEKRLLVIIAAAVIAFIWMDPYHFWSKPPSPPLKTSQPPPAAAGIATGIPAAAAPAIAATSTAPQKLTPEQQKALTAMADSLGGMWRHDPFFSEIVTDAEGITASQFQLGAISIVDGVGRIILNGAILGKGDEYEGWRVVDITASSATISREGAVLKLRVSNRPVENPAKPAAATSPAEGRK